MSLIPELPHQLEVRAEELASGRYGVARRRWRWPVGLAAALATLAAASGATAGLGLWQPKLGHGDGPAPTAVALDPPASLREGVAVLRRPQTGEDRRAAADGALRQPSSSTAEVLTNSVRKLGVTSVGEVVVLVLARDRGRDLACLWVGPARGEPSDGGHSCTDAVRAAAGDLSIGIGAPIDRELEARMGPVRREIQEARDAGRETAQLDAKLQQLMEQQATTLRVVGLAPDGAREVVAAGGRGAVEGNLFEVVGDERSAAGMSATFYR